ncbi:SRPBCC family protein [Streptomyces antimicrobicus]|uniref:SRPBCC family protein n=1 Tax=Streptomyces antimicrobicus TaxID=2883108 RepID=A0ABS8B3R2_9ACTN|nr:SRPBCC family protein [Streptomyces antimicrobicus]MCB5179208.1 SRPBCC family protein [Streptomyces antimicrobicus]
MATKQGSRSSRREDREGRDGRSPVDHLLGELSGYLTAQADQLADKASDKLGDVTDQLQDVAENGGTLGDLGGRLLGGDSPLKAAVGSTLGGLKDKALEAVGVGSGGKGKGRKGGSKPTHICESVDVGVPLRTAYDQWTRYEEFSRFAKGVRNVSQGEDTTSDWKVKVGPSTRSWKATVQEQVPDERIVWTSEGAKGTTRGCVTFHELAPSLTRILVVVEYYPSGLFERTGNLWRAQGRRLRLDLKHFARHVSLSDEEPDGWRGEIRDGEVVRTHEEALEEESAANEQEEPQDYEDEEYEGDAEEPYADEDEDEDEDEDYDAETAEEPEEDEEDEEGEEGPEGEEDAGAGRSGRRRTATATARRRAR